MRNEPKSKISRIISLASKLPYFSLDNLSAVEKDKNYLKVLFSRYSKAGKIIRLKKGLYVAKEYIEEAKKKWRLFKLFGISGKYFIQAFLFKHRLYSLRVQYFNRSAY